MALTSPERPLQGRVRPEADLLAENLLRVLSEGHTAATDGRSYRFREQARSRQRAFIRALRNAGANDVHTHVCEGLDGRYYVTATRATARPAP